MSRPAVLIAAAVLALAAVLGQALTAPLPALACSCMEPLPSLAEVASEPNTVVLAGTIAQQAPERTLVAVDTWFHGPGLSDAVWLNFGTQSMTSCDPFVTPGERHLLVLHWDPVMGTYSVNPCVSSGVIGTDAGDAALAEAEELFNAAVPSPSPTPAASDPPAPSDPRSPSASPAPTEAPVGGAPTGQPADGWLFIVAALGAAALLFAGVALVGLRRGRPR